MFIKKQEPNDDPCFHYEYQNDYSSVSSSVIADFLALTSQTILFGATNGVTFSIVRSLTLIAWLTFNSEMLTITKAGRSFIKPLTLRRGILTLSLPPRITPGDVPSVRTVVSAVMSRQKDVHSTNKKDNYALIVQSMDIT